MNLMKTMLSLAALLAAVNVWPAELREAREFLKQNQPAKAAEVVQSLSAQKPDDPWMTYDLAVAAYAAKDFAKADQIWQELATRQLPPKLRDQVWAQIGNVSYRLGEPLEAKEPDKALTQWEQSREAYKITLASRPRDKTTAYNLKVVELKLARIHSQLAQRLLKEAQQKSLQQTIEKMQAALDHQRTAQNLVPQNEQYQQDVKQTERELSQKFNEKASQEEKKADNFLAKSAPNNWEQREAEKELRNALTDFQEAQTLDPQNQQAEQGEKRVEEKLSKLLTQEGKELQADAKQESDGNPDQAMDKYEQALDKYEEALNLNPQNQEAQSAREQAKSELEQLHMKHGDQMAERGRQEMKHQPARAAEDMLDGLQNYEQALQINPDNQEAPPKIDALEKQLPPLLNALGQKEQAEAAKAEPKSPEQAVAHLEKAATSYEMAQQIDQQNEPAKQGAAQVEKDLARLREQIAQKAQQQAQQQAQNQSKQKQQQQTQTFESMLSYSKNDDKQKQYEESRRRRTVKYDPDQNRIFKNW